MKRLLSETELEELSPDWPKYKLIEQYLVKEEDKVDLDRTISALRADLSYYEGQLREAFNFKSKYGADYSDFTDSHDDNVRASQHLQEAISYLENILVYLDEWYNS